jgi:hypothetical protein
MRSPWGGRIAIGRGSSRRSSRHCTARPPRRPEIVLCAARRGASLRSSPPASVSGPCMSARSRRRSRSRHARRQRPVHLLDVGDKRRACDGRVGAAVRGAVYAPASRPELGSLGVLVGSPATLIHSSGAGLASKRASAGERRVTPRHLSHGRVPRPSDVVSGHGRFLPKHGPWVKGRSSRTLSSRQSQQSFRLRWALLRHRARTSRAGSRGA